MPMEFGRKLMVIAGLNDANPKWKFSHDMINKND
jgi:hypothetical protein